MKYIIIIAFVFSHLWGGIEMGYCLGSPFFTHFSYSFQHVGWMHLILNSISFVSLYNILRKALPVYAFLTCAYLIAVLASFFSEYSIPTVGASGVIYAMIGLFISISIRGKRLRIVNAKMFFVYMMCVAISISLSTLKGNANNMCHIISLSSGLVIGLLGDCIFKTGSYGKRCL